jgi:DNA-binding transcriptional ArsR family regulator
MGRRARGACPRGSPSRSFPGFRGRSSTVVTTTVESVAPEPNRLVERVEAAGRRLTAASITWGARPPARPALALTDRDVDLLAAVDEHRYLTTSMLALLFWGSDSSAARRRLKKLYDAGLLEKFRPAVATGGSHEWIYRLTESGWDVLAAEGEPSGGRSPRELHYLGYVQHDLEVSSLVLTLALRTAPGDGPLAGRLPFEWHGPDRGSVDPARERQHGSPSPAATLPTNGEFMREAAAAM